MITQVQVVHAMAWCEQVVLDPRNLPMRQENAVRIHVTFGSTGMAECMCQLLCSQTAGTTHI
jgi:hypothetical protein